MSIASEIQKNHGADTAGVKKRKKQQPASYWVKQCEDYKRSGLSQKKFCDSRGLAYSTFTKWLYRACDKKPLPDNNFIPVKVETPRVSYPPKDPAPTILSDSTPELSLTINQGLVLSIPKGFDLTTLRQVVKALAVC